MLKRPDAAGIGRRVPVADDSPLIDAETDASELRVRADPLSHVGDDMAHAVAHAGRIGNELVLELPRFVGIEGNPHPPLGVEVAA